MKKRHEQKFVILSLLLLISFNVPVILIFNHDTAFLGIPVLYFCIFFIWLVITVISFIILKRYYE